MEENLENIIKGVIEPTLKAEFIKGVKVGWIGCLNSIKGKTKDLNNAKRIKMVINNMIAEYKANKSEPTP